MRRSLTFTLGSLLLLLAAATVSLPATAEAGGGGRDPLAGIKHIVVIYEENHSFDNLWGGWPVVDGLSRDPTRTPRQTQVDRNGQPFDCLLQDDVNLTTSADPAPNGGLSPSCSTNPPAAFNSHFPNQVFDIGQFITPESTTCFDASPQAPFGPANGVPNGTGEPGGCTRDLVHRFYQEPYQIDGGRMDRYTVGSDAVGLTQGYYDTRSLPLFKFLTSDKHAPRYVIADHFFQSAFGGSFLNHQWLIAAQTPKFEGSTPQDGSTNDLHSIVGTDGHPNNTYPLHSGPVWPAPGGVKDGPLTEAADPATGKCAPPAGAPTPPPGTVCGDFAVNTIQPTFQPFQPGTPPARQLPPSHNTNTGDLLSAKGISWNWYSGGWDNAAGNVGGRGWTNGNGPTCSDPDTFANATFPNCPNVLFQFHHQPFNYYQGYGPGQPGRSHLKDEQDFLADLRAGDLPAVSFVKPVGEENEHPGYTNVTTGEQHLVGLLKAIQADKRDWSSTLVVVTYDEFGGQWDHVPPPTAPGISDQWGPGTRIPAMLLSDRLPQRSAVDHTTYDRLLLAIGSVNKLLPIPGVAEHAHGFRSIAEALYLRDQLVRQIELADASEDPEEREARCTFVVVGAGYTGTEVAAQGQLFTKEAARHRPGLREQRLRWLLVDLAPRVLPELDPRLSRTADRTLSKRGMEIRTGTSVKEATSEGVLLSDGEFVRTRSLVWCVGVRPDPLVERLGLPTERGRLLVNEYLNVPDHPELFACGDAAAVPDLTRPGEITPMTAQHAERQGRAAARNLAASLGLGRRRAYRHHDLGFVVDLADGDGAANPFGMPLSGLPAKAVTRGYHLLTIPANRPRIAADWVLDAVLSRQTVQLGLVRRSAVPLAVETPAPPER